MSWWQVDGRNAFAVAQRDNQPRMSVSKFGQQRATTFEHFSGYGINVSHGPNYNRIPRLSDDEEVLPRERA